MQCGGNYRLRQGGNIIIIMIAVPLLIFSLLLVSTLFHSVYKSRSHSLCYVFLIVTHNQRTKVLCFTWKKCVMVVGVLYCIHVCTSLLLSSTLAVTSWSPIFPSRNNVFHGGLAFVWVNCFVRVNCRRCEAMHMSKCNNNHQ